MDFMKNNLDFTKPSNVDNMMIMQHILNPTDVKAD